MTDDADAGRFDRVLRSIDAIDEMMSYAADAETGRVEGADSTGTVRVAIDPAGVVESVELRRDWRRDVGVEKLDAAVQDAAQAAMSARSAVTSERLAEIGFLDRLDQLDRWIDGEVDKAPAGVPASPSPVQFQQGGTTRGILESIEDTQRRMRTVSERPGDAVGASAFGKVTVTFAVDGSLRCAVDRDWLSRRDDAEIAAALNRAIAAARVELGAAPGRAR